MLITQAVILCGGHGTRLGDITNHVPKPLVEVGGIPFVQYSVNQLKGIGFMDIVLLCGYLIGQFNQVDGDKVRIVGTKEDVDEAVLAIPGLEDLFLLLNGDCFPIMDWNSFCNTEEPRIAVKIVGRDAGVAIVGKQDVESKTVSCGNIKAMGSVYPNYTILGGLHIGTPQGLQRARAFADMVIYGQ